ncbi:DUF1795 domain-containing protein [Paraburkholderia aromaticivorans]|uniref:DUF1795 domain-containing protein n=1 Tax=Paraburkholderia aromaticivorans TaxID=2026199 RepID=A0A248VPS1_9BURK|nr:DUF1795 domain-containing protein [Paraburkholderia aromaticivorans]ASW01034.1 hypothetical protein CJU94_22755 [Paraburkholderia aromaticivorans]
MQQARYYTHEAAFTLPDASYVDSSFNVIRLPQLNANLVISRGALNDGETLESSLDAQMRRLADQVAELHYSAKQPVTIGLRQDVAGFEMQNRFMRGKEPVYQYQLAWLLPGSRTMMALSYTRATALTDIDAAHWSAIKASIDFRSATRD